MAIKILIIIVLLLFAFALSAAEVALYSITSSGEQIKGKVSSLIYGSPQRLLSTILVSNSIAVFLFTLIGASLALDLAAKFSFDKTLAIGLEVVVVSGLLILFADSVPKIVAARNPKLVATICLPLMAVLLVVASPIVYPLNSFLSRITTRRRKPVLTIDSQGLKTLSNVAGSVGVIDKNEADLLGKISFLGEKNVRDTMTLRTEIVSVQDTSQFEVVVETFNRSGHSRLPVYSGAPDNIVGMLYARDVLPVLRKKTARKKFSVRALMRKPVFVPETQSLESLLETFRANRLHIAVVVDEFGGLAGIVTLSDVVREIFGSSAEMPREGALVTKLTDGTFAVKGNARLEEISSDVGGFEFDFEPGVTVSSLLINRHESVPRVGSKLTIGNFEFDVEQATPKTVLQVKLRQLYSGSVRESD
ncbi:MAG: hemolysin family protein [Bacteroidetes bacterium]|nr:hemolysin family protein [Bacteroidota bacterium]